VVLAWASGRRPWWLVAVIAALGVSVATFYVFGRYRFTLVPGLAVLAGAGLAGTASAVRARTFAARTWTVALVAVALAAAASNRTVVSSDEIAANAYFNLAWKLEGEERADGDPVAARRYYERTLALRPAHPDALNNLGNLFARQGRIAQARERFAAAVAADPRHANARLNLGRAFIAEGRPQVALPHLEEAVRMRPADAAAREALAQTLFRAGRPADAVPHYRELKRFAATPAGLNNLGSALAAAGRLREAVAEFDEALRLDPDFAEAHDNLAVAYVHLGDLDGAARHFAAVVRLRPDADAARINLDRVRRRIAGAEPRRSD
jgi:tetratricopeptide (TPR) repeat protein